MKTQWKYLEWFFSIQYFIDSKFIADFSFPKHCFFTTSKTKKVIFPSESCQKNGFFINSKALLKKKWIRIIKEPFHPMTSPYKNHCFRSKFSLQWNPNHLFRITSFSLLFSLGYYTASPTLYSWSLELEIWYELEYLWKSPL